MECFNHTCQGESHKADDKICQDYSYSSSKNGVTTAIVCDGHGGNRYFRSDIGAKFAMEITERLIRQFVSDIDSDTFKGKPFTSVGPVSELPDNYKDTVIDNALRQLFSAIIFQWNEGIIKHAQSTPINVWEKTHVEQKYLNEFEMKIHLERIYGCTLMAFVKTRRYWFAFHIGDGKCISFQESPLWMEPIPWDDRCFLNKTTSLCDSDAINEFRYCYQGDGDFPAAIILGSDGIDDSFGETYNMVNFYIQLIKELIFGSREKALASLMETLPKLSKIGSKDDMSVVCAYDFTKLKKMYGSLLSWQINNIVTLIEECNSRISDLWNKHTKLNETTTLSDSLKIELQYLNSDFERIVQKKKNMVYKLDILLQERDKKSFIPYTDEIGVDISIDTPHR